MTNWDNEIDDVARQMTAGEPETGLTARVLAQVEANATPWWSRRSVWAWSPVAVATTAVLALLIGGAAWKWDNAAGPKVRLKPDTTYEQGRLKAGTKGDEARKEPGTKHDEARLTPDATDHRAGSTSAAARGSGPDVASAFRLRREAALRRTAVVSSAFARSATARPRRSSESGVGAEEVRRTGTGRVNDAVAQASDLAPPPLEIDLIGVESMEAMETLQVPAVAVARLEVPAIGEE